MRLSYFFTFAVLVGTVTAVDPPFPYCYMGRSELEVGDILTNDEYLCNGPYKLVMQSDENLVLYDMSAENKIIWASGTASNMPNVEQIQVQLTLKPDANIAISILFNGKWIQKWSTHHGSPNRSAAWMEIDKEGQMAVYDIHEQLVWKMKANDLNGGIVIG
ncbi:uncharacterized protein LOC106152630 [Lingula anatina]|uniref:Uncharacterized protein LOC106152630 n=1 Tax=Lingula anatina TaxID=7574 RepID=A0A1S3H6J9_LINAN|nr:uncharacterized protein LOC106152630 [Lingula anatina]|eukprot:XP_013381745.1 uncharacterized protein LOC106152630 [Lingula anatina]